MSKLPRRLALAAGAALVAMPAPAASSPDVELIRLAGFVVQVAAQYEASFQPPATTLEEEKAREPMQARLSDALDEAVERLADLRPCTLPGIIAKARAAYAMGIKDRSGELIAESNFDLLPMALVEDLLRIAGRADV